MDQAVKAVRSNIMTLAKAHQHFRISKTCLYYDVKGQRGQKSSSRERAQGISATEEKRLSNALKTMERSFRLSRKELFLIVAEYIKGNNLKTLFCTEFKQRYFK